MKMHPKITLGKVLVTQKWDVIFVLTKFYNE